FLRLTYNFVSGNEVRILLVDPERLHTIQSSDITKLSPNSALVSFVASHMTEYRRIFIPSLEAHMSVSSFGFVNHNTPWDHYPECLNSGKFETKNCAISKYPFYLALESCQEKDYSTEKLWAIFVEDFPDVEGLANY
ncbi:17975_t:CDS:2, partial [Gigaspora margarita]